MVLTETSGDSAAIEAGTEVAEVADHELTAMATATVIADLSLPHAAAPVPALAQSLLAHAQKD